MSKSNSKLFRLTDDRSGESFMLKTGKKGNLTIFDKELNIRRAIRHCPNQKSIFMDEQDQYALVHPIIFVNGYLEVPNTEPITQEFLELHPSNVLNTDKGGWFELVNEEQEAKEDIKDEELKMDIMYTVRQTAKQEDGIHELRAVVSVLTGSVEDTHVMGIEELKSVIYNEIEANPYRFADENGNVTIFEDDIIKRKYVILRAIREGVIKKSADGRSILWARDKKLITTAPRGINLIDYFADYLTTDDGVLVLEEIPRRS